jgi:hypothetical protein
MTHLSPGQIVDVADGGATPALTAHAASCKSCRASVESILDAVRLAAEDPRPEPSPLFWPQLAARIGEAVRREATPVAPWRSWVWRLAPLGAAAVLMIAVGIGSRLWAPASPSSAPEAPVAAPTADDEPADDPSWLLVSVLSAEVSVEEAEASGALPPPGSVDRALVQLDGAERMELAKILREEMAAKTPVVTQGPGA